MNALFVASLIVITDVIRVCEILQRYLEGSDEQQPCVLLRRDGYV